MRRFQMRILLVLCLTSLTIPPARADQAKGAEVYKAKCAMCHGADGKGQTPMGKNLKLKDLGSVEVQSVHDSELKTMIEDGKGKMPANKGKLTNQQVEDVIQYVRTLKAK